MEIKKPQIRYLNDLKKVLYNKEWAKKTENIKLYYIYRGIKKKDGIRGLRYDITVIPSKILGKEFVKTKGHEHLGNFKEIYIVLEGKAIFLMQKRKEELVEDVYAVQAKKGDVVLIPSDYGHVTINPSKKSLALANWIAENCKSSYSFFEKKRGACYYALAQRTKNKEQRTEIKWVKNKNYKIVPKLRFEKPVKNVRMFKMFEMFKMLDK